MRIGYHRAVTGIDSYTAAYDLRSQRIHALCDAIMARHNGDEKMGRLFEAEADAYTKTLSVIGE